jgi:hypothetical protein
MNTTGEQTAEQAAEQTVEHALEHAIALDVAAHQELRPLTAPLEPGSVPQLVEPPTVVFSQPLPTCEFDLARPKYLTDADEEDSLTDQDPPSSEAILQRAIELAEWADELISAELNNDAATQPPAELQTALDSNAAASVDSELAEDQWLIETTMEVVRIAEQAVSQQAALKFKPMRDQSARAESPVHPVHQPDAIERTDSQQPEIPNMSSVQDAAIASSPLDRIHFHAGTHVAGDGVSPAISEPMSSGNKIRRPQDAHAEVGSHLPATRSGSDQPREEALRYLLRHLKGIQDKVQKQ